MRSDFLIERTKNTGAIALSVKKLKTKGMLSDAMLWVPGAIQRI